MLLQRLLLEACRLRGLHWSVAMVMDRRHKLRLSQPRTILIRQDKGQRTMEHKKSLRQKCRDRWCLNTDVAEHWFDIDH